LEKKEKGKSFSLPPLSHFGLLAQLLWPAVFFLRASRQPSRAPRSAQQAPPAQLGPGNCRRASFLSSSGADALAPPISAIPLLSQPLAPRQSRQQLPLLHFQMWARRPVPRPLQMGAVTLHAHPCCLSPLPIASPVPEELPHRGRRDPPSTELGTTARPPSRAISDPVFPLCENPLDPLCLPVQF